MRKIIKHPDSKALSLIYSKTNQSGVNDQIRVTLLEEQSNICAYTEYYLDRGSSKPIEHFNPTLKGTESDGYYNYFICRDQWNMEKGKSARWHKYQPVLHPSTDNFNSQVKYKEGFFITDDGNIQAENLIHYLKLNDPELVKDRKKYINRKTYEITNSNQSPSEYFEKLLQDHPESVHFIRSLEEEFEVKINLKERKVSAN